MYSDEAFKKLLKNWAAQQKPPTNRREHLITKAAITQHKNQDHFSFSAKPPYNDYVYGNNSQWSQTLYTWFFTQSIHAGIHARA